MVQKLNNIIQTRTKFNHKVDNKQTGQKSNKFEKSLEIVISDDKKRSQKNQKINKKNKTDLSPKSKDIKQSKNIFTPFSEKNLPTVIENNDIKNNIIYANVICHNFNQTIITSDLQINNNSFLIQQIINETLENEIPQEEKTEIIEAKLQLINELFNAISNGFNHKSNSEIKEINAIKNNKLINTEYKSLPLQNILNDNIIVLEENKNIEEKSNKTNEKQKNNVTENFINKISNEYEKKTEKNDVKMHLNLPAADSPKNNENIQQRQEKNTENNDNEQKKSETKFQFSKKNNLEAGERSLINDIAKEQILELSNSSKNINHTNSKNLTTYNQFGQIRIQEFTQTTLQLIRSTPENTTSIANLVLKPESLGTLFVQITMTDNKAKINIMADTSEAIKTIEQQIGALKEKLSQNGIITDSIDIGFKSKEGEDKFSNNFQYTKQNDKKQKEELKEYLKTLSNFNEEKNEVLQ